MKSSAGRLFCSGGAARFYLRPYIFEKFLNFLMEFLIRGRERIFPGQSDFLFGNNVSGINALVNIMDRNALGSVLHLAPETLVGAPVERQIRNMQVYCSFRRKIKYLRLYNEVI